MANVNTGLMAAAKAKKDEFYTQLTDIEKELRHYRKHFKGKTIFCNCDDPFESNFFKYFVLNFNKLQIKRLIATCYTGSPIAGKQLSLFDVVEGAEPDTPYKAVVDKVYDITGDGGVDMLDVAELFKAGENELSELEGNGDFRSQECLDLMDEADIVVTNPPFSLFREYVSVLMEHEKKFIIIGNQNAITYKEIFPYIRDNKMWLGYGFNRNCAHFVSPYQDTASDQDHKEGMIRVSGVMWFTNLDIKKRHEEIILVQRYNSENYPHYDNYDGIEVSKSADIPCDYSGAMGVPITFMTKFSPDQFEILGADFELAKPISECVPADAVYEKGGPALYLYEGKLPDGREKHRRLYKRILIRNRHPEEPR